MSADWCHVSADQCRVSDALTRARRTDTAGRHTWLNPPTDRAAAGTERPPVQLPGGGRTSAWCVQDRGQLAVAAAGAVGRLNGTDQTAQPASLEGETTSQNHINVGL